MNDEEAEKVTAGAEISVSFDRPKKRLNLHQKDCLEASLQNHKTSVTYIHISYQHIHIYIYPYI